MLFMAISVDIMIDIRINMDLIDQGEGPWQKDNDLVAQKSTLYFKRALVYLARVCTMYLSMILIQMGTARALTL